MMRRFLSSLLVAAVCGLAAWLALGFFVVDRIAHREESRHAVAVGNAHEQNRADWQRLSRERPLLEWEYRQPLRDGQRFQIRVFEDRRFHASVYRHGSSRDTVPDRYFEGAIGLADWQRLHTLLTGAELRAVSNDVREADVQVSVNSATGHRVSYLYDSRRFATAPAPLRELDSVVYDITRDSTIRPWHGYARDRIDVIYDRHDIPRLLATLDTPRMDLYPVAARLLAGLGEPGLRAITSTLALGETHGFRPAWKYLALLDALARNDDDVARALPAIRQMAQRRAKLPGDRALQTRALELIASLE